MPANCVLHLHTDHARINVPFLNLLTGSPWAIFPWRPFQLEHIHSILNITVHIWGWMVTSSIISTMRQLKKCAVAGMGMFLESYILFGIGNIKPIFKKLYPDCWGDNAKLCPYELVQSISYGEICGVIIGMLLIGSIADRYGRRRGSIVASKLMLIGLTCLLLSEPVRDLKNKFIVFSTGMIVFGIGVGEYSTASTSALEDTNSTYSPSRRVVTTFFMQAVGNFVNTFIIWIMLTTGVSLERIWVSQYLIAFIIALLLVFYRAFYLEESKEFHSEEGIIEDYGTILKYGWLRLIGSGVGWFVWDVTFYGNKLFQGSIIQAIAPNMDLTSLMSLALINSSVALLGLACASLCIDKIGIYNMQWAGFSTIGVLFLICGAEYNELRKPENVHYFQVLYLLTTFFGQFGPNATSWLVPTMSFPAAIRARAMGLSAALGKIGALVAGVLFGLIDDDRRFWVCAICSIIGFIITVLFVPQVDEINLEELENLWRRRFITSNIMYSPRSYFSIVERCIYSTSYYVAINP